MRKVKRDFLLLTGPVLTFVTHSAINANAFVPSSLHARIFTRSVIYARRWSASTGKLKVMKKIFNNWTSFWWPSTPKYEAPPHPKKENLFFFSKHEYSSWKLFRCRSRWETLDRGQYRFKPIKSGNSFVPSPCETEPFPRLRDVFRGLRDEQLAYG